LVVISLIQLVVMEQDVELRARYLIRYRQIARACFVMQNYASLHQFYTALNSLPFKILRKTWARVNLLLTVGGVPEGRSTAGCSQRSLKASATSSTTD